MIYLYGASGHAKVIIEIFEQNQQKVAGLIDIDPTINSLLDYPVYTSLEEKVQKTCEIIISIGDNYIRKKIANSLNTGFAKAIHPSSNVSARAKIAAGTVVMAGTSINVDASIGKHVIVNTNCSIDHDCVIGDFVHISPNAALAGNVTVGEGAHLGIGASVIQGVTIGKWATIGAGAVIIKNVPDYAVVVGNPGKIIKYNNYKS
jgi:sugar O-acyltransferase (sialic acid O-acetyltransferase NeuD family)